MVWVDVARCLWVCVVLLRIAQTLWNCCVYAMGGGEALPLGTLAVFLHFQLSSCFAVFFFFSYFRGLHPVVLRTRSAGVAQLSGRFRTRNLQVSRIQLSAV